MTPSDDCYFVIDGGGRATMTRRDGGPHMEFELRYLTPGPASGLNVATIYSASGALRGWEITYEIISGRVVDISESEDLSHTPAECEVCDG